VNAVGLGIKLLPNLNFQILYGRIVDSIIRCFVTSAIDPKAIERRLYAEWNKGKAAAIVIMDEFYSSDFVFHIATGQDIHGLKDEKKHMSDFYDAFPDAHFTIDDMVAEGNKLAVRYTFTGTHKGGNMGIPPTNKKVTIHGISISQRNADGKIVEEWERYDTLDAMQQLGVLPKPKRKCPQLIL
jgi:steroid delta-isomerase-like uncharacterized protein